MKTAAVNYPVFLIWSEADEAWLAHVVDLPGCIADGQTQKDAIRNAEKAIAEWLEMANELGREVPAPSTSEVWGQHSADTAAQAQKAFEDAVNSTVAEIIKALMPAVLEQVSQDFFSAQRNENYHVYMQGSVALASACRPRLGRMSEFAVT